MTKKRFTIEMIVRQALIAAIYAVLTVVISPLSYGNLQFRFAEILVFLCFYKKEYFIGLTLGCFIANLFSPMLVWDITMGVGATIIALLLIMKSKNLYIAAIWPVLANAFIVGLELYLAMQLPFWVSVLEVAIGEAAVMIIGVVVFKLLERNRRLMYFITLDPKYQEPKKDAEISKEDTANKQEEPVDDSI